MSSTERRKRSGRYVPPHLRGAATSSPIISSSSTSSSSSSYSSSATSGRSSSGGASISDRYSRVRESAKSSHSTTMPEQRQQRFHGSSPDITGHFHPELSPGRHSSSHSSTAVASWSRFIDTSHRTSSMFLSDYSYKSLTVSAPSRSSAASSSSSSAGSASESGATTSDGIGNGKEESGKRRADDPYGRLDGWLRSYAKIVGLYEIHEIHAAKESAVVTHPTETSLSPPSDLSSDVASASDVRPLDESADKSEGQDSSAKSLFDFEKDADGCPVWPNPDRNALFAAADTGGRYMAPPKKQKVINDIYRRLKAAFNAEKAAYLESRRTSITADGLNDECSMDTTSSVTSLKSRTLSTATSSESVSEDSGLPSTISGSVSHSMEESMPDDAGLLGKSAATMTSDELRSDDASQRRSSEKPTPFVTASQVVEPFEFVFFREWYASQSPYLPRLLEQKQQGKENQHIIKHFDLKHRFQESKSRSSSKNISPLFRRFYRYAMDISLGTRFVDWLAYHCHGCDFGADFGLDFLENHICDDPYVYHLKKSGLQSDTDYYDYSFPGLVLADSSSMKWSGLGTRLKRRPSFFLDIGFAPGGMCRLLLDAQSSIPGNGQIMGMGLTLPPEEKGNAIIRELYTDERFLVRENDICRLAHLMRCRMDFFTLLHCESKCPNCGKMIAFNAGDPDPLGLNILTVSDEELAQRLVDLNEHMDDEDDMNDDRDEMDEIKKERMRKEMIEEKKRHLMESVCQCGTELEKKEREECSFVGFDLTIIGITLHQSFEDSSVKRLDHQILFSELYVTLHTLNQGGCVLMRHKISTNLVHQHILYMMLDCFDTFIVHKPLTEFAIAKTFWILWIGFDKTVCIDHDYLKQLKDIIEYDSNHACYAIHMNYEELNARFNNPSLLDGVWRAKQRKRLADSKDDRKLVKDADDVDDDEDMDLSLFSEEIVAITKRIMDLSHQVEPDEDDDEEEEGEAEAASATVEVSSEDAAAGGREEKSSKEGVTTEDDRVEEEDQTTMVVRMDDESIAMDKTTSPKPWTVVSGVMPVRSKKGSLPPEAVVQDKGEDMLKVMNPMFNRQLSFLKDFCMGKRQRLCNRGESCTRRASGECNRAHSKEEMMTGLMDALDAVNLYQREQIKLHSSHSPSLMDLANDHYSGGFRSSGAGDSSSFVPSSSMGRGRGRGYRGRGSASSRRGGRFYGYSAGHSSSSYHRSGSGFGSRGGSARRGGSSSKRGRFAF